jgi:hypothetical protein
MEPSQLFVSRKNPDTAAVFDSMQVYGSVDEVHE